MECAWGACVARGGLSFALVPISLSVVSGQFKRLTEQVSRVAEQVSTLAKAANLDRLMQEGGSSAEGVPAAPKAAGNGAPLSDEFGALNLTYIRPNIIGGCATAPPPLSPSPRPTHSHVRTRPP